MDIGRGNGKLLLFGEHSAVYGHPSLGLQLPRVLEVRLERATADRWEFPGLEGRAADLVAGAVSALPGILGREVEPRRLTVGGDLPMAVGFGSSAAFCTALLRAVAPERYRDGTPTVLWEDAHRLEHVFHGTPSGIDTGLSLLPGASLVLPRPPAIPEARTVRLPPAWLVVGAMPRTGSTAALVAQVRSLRAERPAETESMLQELGSLAGQASGLSGADATTVLGGLARRAGAILAALGLSTPALDEACAILDGQGALGCKLSGAGGGGAFFGVYDDGETAERARNALVAWLERSHSLPEGPFSLVMELGAET